MPIQPPDFRVLRRFDPEFLTDEDLEDLASFTGMDVDECRHRVESYSLEEHAERWRAEPPQTADELLAFYNSTDLYLWELMQWHASRERAPYWEALTYLAEHYPPEAGYRRVYDFGCGVGTDALYLASKGYDVTLVDVDGPAFQFAQHRFERRGLAARFVESRSTLPEPAGEYDVAICFDMFEHLPEPLEAARRLVAALRPGGLLFEQSTFDFEAVHPCHLNGGINRYSGSRWRLHLAGLGLKPIAPFVLQKSDGFRRNVEAVRYRLWRLSGLWISRVGRS